MRSHWSVSANFIAAVSLVGCSSTPEKNTTLEQIRSSYSVAQSSPDITKHAAVELQQAGLALENAENAWSKREDPAQVDHLAYLAKQRVAIAQDTGKLKTAELAIANADIERDKVRLEVRTAEANSVRQQVGFARETAERKAAETASANAVRDSDTVRQAAETAASNVARDNEVLRQAAITSAAAKQSADELAAANTSLKQMEAQLAELNAKKTERGLVITLGDVLFDVNKSELKPGSERNVQKIADFLNEYPQRKAQIEGFTDNTGDDGYNQLLSERRAEAVRAFLISKGISGDRASARGYGEANPIASNDTPGSRQLNRRVEIVLSDDESAADPR